MVSERVQRQIDRFLEQAEEAMAQSDWATALDRAQNALALDPENADAGVYLAAAGRRLKGAGVPALTPAAGTPALPGPELPESFVGRRYRVVRSLGEGGKKSVFLCYDTLLAREVAFALIKTDGLDQEGRERITREAQAMGKLGTHPHIVSVFDMGNENGRPYLITELMGGGDVEGLLEKAEDHRLPVERAVEIGQQVCRGLEFAHEHGLIHRDLKPGNVWLTADPSTGSGRAVAKIGDFGLAVALDRSRLTQAGMMVGTVAYMPPEQAMGGEVGPRSDLYSLGAMLYEMVCGRPPFVGEESVAIITQHLNTPPVAPSWHRPDCPAGLESLILRLLEKGPAKRPASASEVRHALDAVRAGSPGPGDAGRGDLAPTGATDNPLYRRTFVGREQELKQLQATFDAAVSGQGALVMVAGEPGIGKTALCEQLATYVTIRSGKALVGHCYEEGSFTLPYLPFVEAIRSYVLARPSEDLQHELGSGATEVARIVSEVREKVSVEPRPSGDPQDDRWRLYQAVMTFLRNASVVQPLLLLLEDLHWADSGTLDFLVHLSRNLQGTRLLIIGTYRDVEVDRSHPLSAVLGELRRAANFGRIPLRGLTPDEVQRMLTNLSGQHVRWGLAEAVHRQTEGSPLFIQEVLRYLVEEGLITREGGRWQRTGETLLELGIPEGLRDVIGKRLSRLTPACNQVLAVASVIGRDFRLDVLQQVTGLPEEETVGALEEAKRAGILEEQGTVGTGVQLRFGHAFFRQTLYEEIFAPRRIRLHQQVGRALERVYGRRLPEHAAELAEHFAQSTEPDDLVKALSYSERAAQRSLGVYAYGEAVRLLEQALKVQDVLDPDDRAKRCDLLLALSPALQLAADPKRAAEKVAPEAWALAEAMSDRDRAAQAAITALQALNAYGAGVTNRMPAYRTWAQRLDGYASPGTSARAWADFYLSRVLAGQGRYRDGRTALPSILEQARALGDQDMLWYFGGVRIGEAAPGDAAALALLDELASSPREGAAARRLQLFLSNSGLVLLALGERERAEEHWQELDQLAERTRDPNSVRAARQMQMIRAMVDGRLEDAVAANEQYVARTPELGSLPVGRAIGTRLAALLYLGRAGAALEFLEQLTAMAGVEPTPTDLACHALCLGHCGRQAEAQELLNRFTLQSGDIILDQLTVTILAVLLEAAMLVEDRLAIAEFTSRLSGLPPLIDAENTVVAPALICVARHQGAAAALLGEPAKAQSHYQQALEACEKIRFRPEIALTRLHLAELLLEHYPDQRTAAINHLDFAIAEFREMKMQPSLERALRHKGLLGA